MRRFFSLFLAVALGAGSVSARPAVDAVYGLPPMTEAENRRCTADGLYCVYLDTYVADVCRNIERAASRQGLDKNFLARLLWKESRFEPSAISPAGAEGIAQFIPSTAAIVDLHDPFNPAEAISVSAAYLSRLSRFYGSIGIAAVAYNGGENRADRFMRSGGTLPYETQDYVEAITGFNAWRWREDPPGADKLDLRLDGDAPFLEACTRLAGNRELREFTTGGQDEAPSPWGVILASHPTRGGVQGQINRLNRALGPILDGKRVSYVRRSLRGGGRRVYTAQVGWDARGDANRFCQKAKMVGIRCIVLRN
ncbi:lytic transglycosylase domain-containing protein [Paracoccus aerodenitrificans]|uniref:lytic transglycosylase domain-containing protein n=1 Tax=Paracoccus aerodenitrificans TaxID=3017781 RepID=UPI0022F0E085|nr:lytic transglycosylase domain-containing protein [Paracoccus aerodenitrificans]WBU62977.1 lytic transglycosylase domain-containing protein [Paracoccus aerodenitrificans]